MYVLEKIRLSVPIEISFRYIGRNFQQIGPCGFSLQKGRANVHWTGLAN